MASKNAVVGRCCLGFLAKRDKPAFAVDKDYLLDESGLFGDRFTMDYLLHPPPSITFQMGKQLADTLKQLGNHVGDCRRFNPEVFICHAIGRREHDSLSAGPGVFFAAAIMRLLFSYGIPCLSTLMVNQKFQQAHRSLHSNDPHVLIMERLASRAYSCKVLLVIETKALYEDQKCLEQIACAIRCNRVELMRVRFDDDNLMPKEMQWGYVKQATGSKKLMLLREEVQRYMDESRTVQADSPEDPKLLMQMIPHVASKSERTINWNPDPDPWGDLQTRQDISVEGSFDGSDHNAGNEMAMERSENDGKGACAGRERVSFLQDEGESSAKCMSWKTTKSRSIAGSKSTTTSMRAIKSWLHQIKTVFTIPQPQADDAGENKSLDEQSTTDTTLEKLPDGKKNKPKKKAKAKAGAGKGTRKTQAPPKKIN